MADRRRRTQLAPENLPPATPGPWYCTHGYCRQPVEREATGRYRCGFCQHEVEPEALDVCPRAPDGPARTPWSSMRLVWRS